MNRISLAVLSALICSAVSVSHVGAVTLVPDYSSFGTAYQDAAGQLFTTAGAGRNDVTANFKKDVNAAFTYLQGAITLPWTETIKFTLEDIGTTTVADSAI